MKRRALPLGKLTCLASILALALPAAAAAQFTCLPSCDNEDGRFLVVTDPSGSTTLETLTDNILDVAIRIEACDPGSSEFSVGIFDGDVGQTDEVGERHWDIREGPPPEGGQGKATWQVWTDADNDGETPGDVKLFELVDDPDFPPLTMPDNAWIDRTFTDAPAALNGSGECVYRVRFQLDECCGTVTNAFKVRVKGDARIEVYQQPFSYIAALKGFGTSDADGILPDARIVYPACAGESSVGDCLDLLCPVGTTVPECLAFLTDPVNTTFDGDFSFFFEVPSEQEKLVIWGGDLDRGKWDCSDLDSDDPNSPNIPKEDPVNFPGVQGSLSCPGSGHPTGQDEDPPDCFDFPAFPGPPFSIPQEEDVATGLLLPCGRTTGAPADDNFPGNGPASSNALFVREPSIRFEVYRLDLGGDVLIASNEDPSGNLEWEKFRVDTIGTASPDPDGSPDAMWPDTFPPGLYELRILGLDMENLNTVYMPYAIVGESCKEFKCEGGIVELTMRYLGAVPGVVRAEKDSGNVYFPDTLLMPGQDFTFTGIPAGEKLASNTNFYVDGQLDTGIHTSCSKPIYPGLKSGSFLVVQAWAGDSGLICDETFPRPCETTAGDTLDFDDEEVGWKFRNTGDGDFIVNELTLGWPAANGDLLEVRLKNNVIWSGSEPPPATATTLSGLIGHVERVVKKGEEKELVLVFDNDASTTGNYAIRIGLLEGCSVQFGDFEGFLGDYVWEDTNGNGVQDGGEPGVDGVDVELLDPGTDGACNTGDEVVLATTTTAGGGIYGFAVDTPADYCVRVVPPAGRDFTVPNAGGDDARDSDVDPATGQTIQTIMMSAGETDLTWDAGLIRAASLGDFVWHDVNANGVQNPPEPGIPGVPVRLLTNPDGDPTCTVGGDEVVIASTVTGAGGLYLFDGLQPGNYCVEFDSLPGMTRSPRGVGTPDKDSDPDPTTGRTGNINLDQGEEDLTWDSGLFGNLPCILDIVKTCDVPPPPPTGGFLCEKPIDALTMIWDPEPGSPAFGKTVDVLAWKDTPGQTLVDSFTVMPGEEHTVVGYAPKEGNDVIWEIFDSATGDKLGESTFHLSCSDDDMDGPEDCGNRQGDGKGQSGFLEDWILEGMVDAVGSFDCTAGPSGGTGSDTCELFGAGDVTYTYVITNIGPIPIPIVTVEDDPDPGAPFTVDGSPILGLAPGESVTLQEVRFIDETTSNIATATGVVSVDPFISCSDDSNEVVVTVTSCELTGGAFSIDGKKVDWEISNPGALTTTVDNIVITWPAQNKKLRKVKLGGKEIWTGSVPQDPGGVVITPNKGTTAERQIAPGATKTLRFEFEKNAGTSQMGYEIMVNFDEGCSVVFVPGSGPFTCTKPIDVLTMKFAPQAGSPAFGKTVEVKAWKDEPGEILLGTFPVIGGEVSVNGYAPKDGNDVIWELIDTATGMKLGDSTFHLSCSDQDMNGEEDCGKRQGDGKGQSGFLEDWLLEGMVDATGSFDCTP